MVQRWHDTFSRATTRPPTGVEPTNRIRSRRRRDRNTINMIA
ncbi:MAG: hypothetical protein AVDCRST_MAG70-2115 [uncultured Thermomicrobiales bacterium]|uniref:Uncharacterized protein n=1 Tax=uncultured Thermomicrobiales bacterium TaxID=1645740 RepID=A0A6J4V2T6_9BACT|nr:MAG: hypothetical protein AVDCRST_MAG70-2115 [uncultured Thermomicrobiales bacterium]